MAGDFQAAAMPSIDGAFVSRERIRLVGSNFGTEKFCCTRKQLFKIRFNVFREA